MAFLPDSEADRVRDMVRQPRPQDVRQLAEWTARLLRDRDAGRALIQRLARLLYRARRGLRLGDDVSAILAQAHEAAREPWPGKLTCAKCGAAAAELRTDVLQVLHGPRVQHVVVHPDGQECPGGDRVVIGDRPVVDELGFPTKE